MNLIPYRGITPIFDNTVFIADGVQLIGDVKIGQSSSIWYNAVLRGDLAPITIGSRTNLQDGVIAHVNTDQPLIIADDVSIGHAAIVHGCTIGSGSLIGMGAIILNGAHLEEFVLLGAGSLVTENCKLPSYTLAIGSPAKVIRELTDDDIERMKRTTRNYIEKGAEFLRAQRGVHES